MSRSSLPRSVLEARLARLKAQVVEVEAIIAALPASSSPPKPGRTPARIVSPTGQVFVDVLDAARHEGVSVWAIYKRLRRNSGWRAAEAGPGE